MPRRSSWDRALDEWVEADEAAARAQRIWRRFILSVMLILAIGTGALTWYVWPGHRDTVRCRCTCPEQP